MQSAFLSAIMPNANCLSGSGRPPKSPITAGFYHKAPDSLLLSRVHLLSVWPFLSKPHDSADSVRNSQASDWLSLFRSPATGSWNHPSGGHWKLKSKCCGGAWERPRNPACCPDAEHVRWELLREACDRGANSDDDAWTKGHLARLPRPTWPLRQPFPRTP
jgi:hypothetical protein